MVTDDGIFLACMPKRWQLVGMKPGQRLSIWIAQFSLFFGITNPVLEFRCNLDRTGTNLDFYFSKFTLLYALSLSLSLSLDKMVQNTVRNFGASLRNFESRVSRIVHFLKFAHFRRKKKIQKMSSTFLYIF